MRGTGSRAARPRVGFGATRVRWVRRQVGTVAACLGLVVAACDSAPPQLSVLSAQALDARRFGALVGRISEPGGYFDTDNLISNERGYLNVIDALAERGMAGGAYVGVGPDQNFSYIAQLRPSIAFIVDIRRDNLLHHLLLKALMEMSPTRVEFLSHLHGVAPPADAERWSAAPVDEVVALVDSAWSAARTASGGARSEGPGGSGNAGSETRTGLHQAVRRRVAAYGVPLSDEDLDTIDRFHRTFMAAGLSLRFTSFGRAPRPYYPTYRQLVLETDAAGDRASYLADAERYHVVRDLHLANRIIPVVGDLAGPHALREIGAVLEASDVEVHAVYTSNVEFYLWRDRTFTTWVDNVGRLPASDDAVVVRSYFPNLGRPHPSALRGYYATQSLQPLSTLAGGGFDSYWDVVTRDLIPLR